MLFLQYNVQHMNKDLLKYPLLLLLTGLALFAFIHFNLYVYFTDRDRALQLLNSLGPYAAPVLILLQILQVIIAPIPREVTGLMGGYLYGPILGTLYSTIGLTIGSWIAFMLARIFGMPFVEKAINKTIIQKYDHFMEHQGRVVSFALFLIPGFPKDSLCYIIGLSRMDVLTFLVISTAGRLLGTIQLSVCGSCVRNNQLLTLFIVIIISCIFIFLAYLFRERWLEILKNKTGGK